MPRLAKQKFTESTLARLQREAAAYAAKKEKEGVENAPKVFFDGGTPHLGVRFRNDTGTFFCWYRTPGGVKRANLGVWSNEFPLSAAKNALAGALAKVKVEKVDLVAESKKARVAARLAKAEEQAREVGTVEKRFKLFMRAKEAEQIRTAHEYESVFKNHILPEWKVRAVQEIAKADITKLLDKIEEKHGAKLRDRTLAYLRPFLWWHAEQYEHAIPLMPKRRLKPDSLRRTRSLDDDEIRLMWTVADTFETPAFGAFIKMLLVTGQRRTEVAGMRRDEIDAEHLWTIPAERFKGKVEHAVPLSELARKIIEGAPKVNDDFVFSTGESHIKGFSKFKIAFDEAMLKRAQEDAEAAGKDPEKIKIKPWRLHDLRRTARSLLSRAGARSDWAEIFIGHALPGLRKTYDRHSYRDEKRFCADALANMIGRVLRKETGEVLQFKPVAA